MHGGEECGAVYHDGGQAGEEFVRSSMHQNTRASDIFYTYELRNVRARRHFSESLLTNTSMCFDISLTK